jgi:hypothetical protein
MAEICDNVNSSMVSLVQYMLMIYDGRFLLRIVVKLRKETYYCNKLCYYFHGNEIGSLILLHGKIATYRRHRMETRKVK